MVVNGGRPDRLQEREWVEDERRADGEDEPVVVDDRARQAPEERGVQREPGHQGPVHGADAERERRPREDEGQVRERPLRWKRMRRITDDEVENTIVDALQALHELLGIVPVESEVSGLETVCEHGEDHYRCHRSRPENGHEDNAATRTSGRCFRLSMTSTAICSAEV